MDHLSIGLPLPGASAGRSVAPLDEIDQAIVRELTNDGRISIRTLAERVRVSRTNAYSRLERLLADGVITGFTARVDPAKAGLGTTAYLLVNIEQKAWRGVCEQLLDVPYVQHVTMVGGDVDILVLVRTPDNATLRDLVLARVHTIDGVRSTRTWLAFEEAAGHNRLPLPTPGLARSATKPEETR